MAAGFPVKADYVTGDVMSAANMNDLAGTLNYLDPTAKGDLFPASSGTALTRLAVGTNGQVLTADSAEATGLKWAAAAGAIQVLTVNETQASGTQGGTFTSGAWRTRTLNTSVQNTISGASLSSNQITLPAGTYSLVAIAPAYQVESNQARIYNITDSAVIVQGNNSYGSTTVLSQQMTMVSATFTIAATKVIELQHYGGQTKASQGFGSAVGLGFNEIYSSVSIVKVV